MRPRLKPTVDKEEKLFHRCVKPGDFVLDAGCGDGRNGLSLTKIKGAS
jgi:ubiquinone/menaquinone biosynthesis C-methylase UbiE